MSIILDGISGITTPNIVANAGNIASPVFTGNPVAPTPSSGDKDTTLATTAYANSLLVEYVVGGSAVTEIVFDNLDLNSHKSYTIEGEIINTSANNAALDMFINDDEVTTNYYTQAFWVSDSPLKSARANTAELTYVPATSRMAFIARIQSVGGYIKWMSESVRNESTVELAFNHTIKAASVTNLTKIKIKARSALAIGIGSKIRIYRGDV